MDINNYIPTNFDYDKMNAFKFLYLYRRKKAITTSIIQTCDLSNPDDVKNKQPFRRSFEYIQQETGMSTEDLSEAISIGLWIDEYITLSKMNQKDFLNFVIDLETDHEIPEDLQIDLEELSSEISNMLNDKKEERNKFKEIINDNFNNQQEWPDS